MCHLCLKGYLTSEESKNHDTSQQLWNIFSMLLYPNWDNDGQNVHVIHNHWSEECSTKMTDTNDRQRDKIVIIIENLKKHNQVELYEVN